MKKLIFAMVLLILVSMQGCAAIGAGLTGFALYEIINASHK